MQTRSTIPVLVALALGACADEPEIDFRGYSGDEDLTIYMGDTATEDCDIWDLLGPEVVGGSASSTPGATILEGSGWLVLDGNGTPRCEYTWDGTLRLRDLSDGSTVLTSHEVFVIVGDWSPNTGPEPWLVTDYTLREANVREGGWWGKKILTADVHMAWMHPARALLIGAAIEGMCGAPGLDAVPESPPNHPEG